MQYVIPSPLIIRRFYVKYLRISLKHSAEGGSLAEEVISSIRTAQAFGTQLTLAGLFNTSVNGSLVVDLKTAIWQGGSLASFFFIVYSVYALGSLFHFLSWVFLTPSPF